MTGVNRTGARVAAFLGALVLVFGAALAVGNAATPLDRGVVDSHDPDASSGH